MLCPIYHYNAQAADTVEGGAETPMSLTVAPTISVALDEFSGLDITPESAGKTTSGTTTLKVNTTNTSGYKIYLRTGDGSASLTNTSGGTTIGTIGAVSGTVQLASFQNNTWGYALDKSLNASTASYKAVPTSASSAAYTAASSATGVSDDTYTLAFGAKVNTAIPAGEYKNSVIVSVIAEPMPPSDLTEITTMQEMTAEICENTDIDVSNSLTDTRSGNQSYVVYKEKDGNCWMRTNLAVTGTVSVANVTGGTNGTYALTENTNYWNKNSTYGLYYNWTAATAGTGSSVTSGYYNSSASICPTGGESNANWVLPRVGTSGSAYEGVGSFKYLLQQYGITVFDTSTNASGNLAIMTGSDLAFLAGGYVYSGTLYEAGSGGYYWSRTTSSSSSAYYLYFSDSGFVGPARSSDRSSGRSIRCLYPSTSTKSAVLAQ